MAKKIKIELTEKQCLNVVMTLQSHCFDIDADPNAKVEQRVINNAVDAMQKGYEEWKGV